MTTGKPDAKAMAMEHWGGKAPPWVMALANACNDTSQAVVAKKIKRSASLINQVLRNKYPGDLKDIQSRVETALKSNGVKCPILGDISGPECLEHQRAPYNPGNHLAVRMFLACRRCPLSCKSKGGANVSQ